MIKKIIKQLEINSYRSDMSLRKTLQAAELFRNYLYLRYTKKYQIFSTHAPLVYNVGSEQNENNYLINEPKAILFPHNNILGELASGSRKWCRILATNLDLKKTEALFVHGSSFNMNSQINESIPAVNSEIIITIPIYDENYLQTKFIYDLRNLYEEFFSIIELLFTKLDYKRKILKGKLSLIDLSNIHFSDIVSLEKEIISYLDERNQLAVIYNIPKKSIHSQLFSYDVYDWDYFARFYGYNFNSSKLLELFEVSVTVDDKIKLQCQNKNLKSYCESNYYWLAYNNKLKKCFQIKFNLTQIFTYLFNKYTVNEVCSSVLDEKILNLYEDNKIIVL